MITQNMGKSSFNSSEVRKTRLSQCDLWLLPMDWKLGTGSMSLIFGRQLIVFKRHGVIQFGWFWGGTVGTDPAKMTSLCEAWVEMTQ